MAKGVLVHIRVPAEVLRDIEEFSRGETRGAFVTEALRVYLRRLKQLRAVEDGAGLLAENPPPHWATDEAVDAWVRDVRQGWEGTDNEGTPTRHDGRR